MQKPTLGDGVPIDVDRLLVSRLLLQANSGGGKSYALRRLLEQTFGHCQHIVVDPDGEFHTLREKFDYVLAGKGGEAAATLETAELLAVRLLELGVSAIVDISDLGVDRAAFVAKFVDALMNAPRELWHSVLVVVDEAHRFCPETGRARRKNERVSIEESKAAVISLMDSGRKRGFCGVLATQRVSKLSKDATAECNNKLIGRSVEADAKRASEELGMSSRDAMQQLRKLRAGEFFAFGPALSDDVRLVKVGHVQTTHPEPGKAAPPPTPPRAKVREILRALADLPKEAAEEARTSQQLRVRVRELEHELGVLKRTGPSPRVETKIVEKTIDNPAHVQAISEVRTGLEKVVAAAQAMERVLAAASTPRTSTPASVAASAKRAADVGRLFNEAFVDVAHAEPQSLVEDAAGAKAVDPQSIVDALRTLESIELPATIENLAAWLGVHPKTKSLLAGIGRARADGLLTGLQLTNDGRAVARVQNAQFANTTLRRGLSEQQQRIVDTLATLALSRKVVGGRAYGDAARIVSLRELAAWVGVHPKTKGFLEDLGKLRTRGYLAGMALTELGRRAAVVRELDDATMLQGLDDLQARIVAIVRSRGSVADIGQLASELAMHPKTKSLLEALGKLRDRGFLAAGWPLRAGDVLDVGQEAA